MKVNHKNLILQKITGLSKEQLFLTSDIQLNIQQQSLFDNYIQRLSSGKPIEYILENAEFYGLNFFVDNRVLIPRNDTEIIVDQAVNQSGDIYIDIGTGSGCIPISVIKNSTQNLEQIYALDISKKALEVAETNLKNHNLQDQIQLLHSNLLEKILEKDIQGTQIIITANLPYIKQDDFENMDKSVYLNEPNLALYGGKKTGFELYETLIGQCQELVKSGNKIVLFTELGFDQKKVCEDFLKSQSLEYKIYQDNGGVDRCVRVEI